MKYYIIFGPPGAGKGTQAGAISKKYNLKHISTGELLRKEMAEGTELGKKASELIDAGFLVPDEVVEGMIEAEFARNRDVDGFLLDGYPRTLAQAESLEQLLGKRQECVTAVVSLIIPDGTIYERIRHRAGIEGREDDCKDEVIANRIATYHKKTEPIISFYKAAGKYSEVDGLGTVEEVRERIFGVLG